MESVTSDHAAGSAVKLDEVLVRFDDVPTYAEFFERCLLPNRPCIFPIGLVAHWDAVRTKAWEVDATRAASTTSVAEGRVGWQALKRQYGSHVAPVVITRITPDGTLEEDRSDMPISQAVDLIHQLHHDHSETDVQSIYIKDWHLIKQLHSSTHEQVEPYTVPDVFADDWMNNLSHPERDDFRFVYAGTRGSQTLLHRDVYTSYSWSTNVIGVKTWYLFPPRTVPHLRRFPNVSTSPLIPSVEALHSEISEGGERKEYPRLEDALSSMQTITQSQGETIFIPSNWYHQVNNVTDCISINRNWCNSVNVPSLYRSIVEELDHVEESLCDVREMLSNYHRGEDEGWKKEFFELVQDVAVKDAGWAWAGFWDMVLHNLEHLATGERRDLRPGDGWVSQRLLPLVDDFVQREDAKWLDGGILNTALRCKMLLEATGE